MSPPPIKHKALLNVDLGEAYGNFKCGPDDEIIPLIDHANIACGHLCHRGRVSNLKGHKLQGSDIYLKRLTFLYNRFHAGDPLIMLETVRACKKHNIKAGAHPGLPDIQGFGRREIQLELEEFTAITTYQVGALKGFLDAEGVPLHHVKPHGKLYGMMCRDYEIAKAVMLGIPKGVPVFGLAGTNMEKAANDLGIPFWAEFYGDVKYNKDGSLVIDKKKKPWNLEDVRKHVSDQLNTQSVIAVDGSRVELPVKEYPISICCHSDSPGCMDIIRTTKEIIDKFNTEHGR